MNAAPDEGRPALADTLIDAFQGFADERAASLDDLGETQTITQALLQHEASRLRRRLGEDHPRVRSMMDRLERSRDVHRHLVAEAEIARIRLPEVPEEAILVYGRVTDDALHGIGDLLIMLTDDAGKPIREFGRAETDTTGTFALVIDGDPKVLDHMEAEKGAALYLGVFTSRGELVYMTLDPLHLVRGARLLVEIRLNRDEVPTPRSGGQDRQSQQRRGRER